MATENRYLTRSNVTLLLHSEIINEYTELKAALQSIGKKYGDKQLEKMPDSIVRQIKTELHELISAAGEEWQYDPRQDIIIVTTDSEKRECELCGNRELNYLAPVDNIKNGKVLYMGSSCHNRYGNTAQMQSCLRCVKIEL